MKRHMKKKSKKKEKKKRFVWGGGGIGESLTTWTSLVYTILTDLENDRL